jgi:hypothetical protein
MLLAKCLHHVKESQRKQVPRLNASFLKQSYSAVLFAEMAFAEAAHGHTSQSMLLRLHYTIPRVTSNRHYWDFEPAPLLQVSLELE